MAEIKKPSPVHGTQCISTQLSRQIISLCDNSSEPWAIKNYESRYLYANAKYIELLNLPTEFNITNQLDSDIPHPSSKSASYFHKYDREVQTSEKNVSSLNIYPFGSKEIIQPYICKKAPFYDEKGNCMGIILHTKKLQVFSAIQYLNEASLNAGVDKNIKIQKKKNFFTDKELEVIFFLMQSIKCKVISEILGLSCRTIENKLQSMYKKANVCCLDDFKAFCIKNGFDKYNKPISKILPHDITTSTLLHPMK